MKPAVKNHVGRLMQPNRIKAVHTKQLDRVSSLAVQETDQNKRHNL